MKRIKYGRLYWLPMEAADIDQFFFVRLFRKLNINYIPLTLCRYNELYLREDRSKYSRLLINACRKLGIVTHVVQEGPVYQPYQAQWSHLPLYADVFLCPEEDYEMWIREGMPKDRIKTYDPQKKKENYREIFFLEPLVTWAECPNVYGVLRNVQILKTVYQMLDKDVVFHLDLRNRHLIAPFFPSNRLVSGDKEALIKQYQKIYCFSSSTIAGECKQAGKLCQWVDQDSALPTVEACTRQKDKNSSFVGKPDGVAFTGAFVEWNDLGFTWRKNFHNARIFKGIAEVINENVWIKPHHSHAQIMLPFLPPERVVWEKAEDLILKYDKIYCCWDSSVRRDCEMLGKTPNLIGGGDI